MSTPDSAQIGALQDSVNALAKVVDDHIRREEGMWITAFPGGDIAGHRKAHEAMIDAAAEQRRFWADLRLDLAKKGVVAILAVLAGLVVLGIYVKLGITPPKP